MSDNAKLADRPAISIEAVCPTCGQYADALKRLNDLIGTLEDALHKAEA